MSVGGLASVLERIGTIESRFGRPAVTVPERPGFDAVLEQQTPAPAIGGDTPAALGTARPPVFATPIAGTAVGGLYGDLDRLAAIGALTPGATPLDDGHTELDRLAAIGALPVGHAHTVPGPTPAAGAVPATTPFAAEFERAGLQHGVPPRLLAAVGWVESRYQVDAISPDGAIGVMQIMPMTAEELGVDPRDPIDAIDGAARLLASHQRRFGSWDLALAAYHSGAGAVSRNGNQPPPRAATYVQLVHDRLEHA